MQMLVPCILLKVELDAGFSLQPLVGDGGFRIMGCCLYLYSLYSMYNNALDECRSQLLQWCIDQDVPSGFWAPMMMGEVTNVFVSLILVLTLFVIFVDVINPADLILNAVAVNFLGAVDGEFVDDEMKNDALKNFKHLFYDYGADVDVVRGPKNWLDRCMPVFLDSMLWVILVSGVSLSIVFLLVPSPSHTDFSSAAQEAGRGLGSYPKLI